MIGVARWVSIAAHPFVMVGVMVGSAAARQNSAGEVVRSVLIVLAFTIVPLLVLMVRQVRAGAWQNVDASNTSERPILYVAGGLALIALLAYLALARPQSFLLRGAAGLHPKPASFPARFSKHSRERAQTGRGLPCLMRRGMKRWRRIKLR